MAAPAGMTMSESAALNRLTSLCSAITLSDSNIDKATKQTLTAKVRALRLFVQAEERALAQALLADIEQFASETSWEGALLRKAAQVRRTFGWVAS